MKVESHPEVLMNHSQRAFDATVTDVLDQARVNAPRRTGEYAATLTVVQVDQGDVLRSAVTSPLPRGGAVEHGANVGPRRGPHMGGAHAVERAASAYTRLMAARLRSEPI